MPDRKTLAFPVGATNDRKDLVILAEEALDKLAKPKYRDDISVRITDIEPEMGFTTAVIVIDNKAYVGTSKRMNYARVSDRQDDAVGINIAVSRALARANAHSRKSPGVCGCGRVLFIAQSCCWCGR